MVPWPRSLSLVSHPGVLEGTLWVWFGPLPPRAVRAWTLGLASAVATGSVAAGATVSAALAEAGWLVAALVFPGLAFGLLSVALLAALRLFRGRPEGFRITRNQLRVGRFAIPLDAIRGVRAFERPARLQSLGLVVDSEQGELWLEVNPFAHTLADLQWLAARMGDGPDVIERGEVPDGLLALKAAVTLVMLFGPPAVGKLTVAREVAAATGFRLFHNHLVVDTALSLYDFGTDGFVALRAALWEACFRRLAADRPAGVVFTFSPEDTVPQAWLDARLADLERWGVDVRLVELWCAPDELERRIDTSSRRGTGKLTSVALYRELRDAGRFASPVLPEPHLRVDVTDQRPEASATEIVAFLG